MATHPRAGFPVAAADRIDVEALRASYFDRVPDPDRAEERVSFGTSGHRGTSLRGSFQERHIFALTQAIVELRAADGVLGPLFIGADSHALSSLALRSALRVLAAHRVDVRRAPGDELVATPLVSRAILRWNANTENPRADGIIITPSHNPPQDGGFKYTPSSGGPAEPTTTDRIAARANELLRDPAQLRIASDEEGAAWGTPYDFIGDYVEALACVIDIERIRSANVVIGVDPLGGAALPVWRRVRELHGLNIEILNEVVDPCFSFMSLDHDGVVRMDCSSPWAMKSLAAKASSYDVCVGNDPDSDRHGIVTARGVMNPNLFLALSVDYLLETRRGWDASAKIGRTVVTSALIDRVASHHGREVLEVPVGFKWFVEGMIAGTLVFGCEESAGASFVQFDGAPWSTDKDGIIMGLLAAELVAARGRSLDAQLDSLFDAHGRVWYARRDAAADARARARVKAAREESVSATSLAGHPITRVSPVARGNGASIGGLRVDSEVGWVAMRPSGTEDILKIYGESFVSEEHLQTQLDEAEAWVRAWTEAP